MAVSDQLSIETPELIGIDLPLAGIGSRFMAVFIDTLLWFAGLLLLSLALFLLLPGIHAFSKVSEQWAEAAIIFLVFLFNWGYFTLFEAFWRGQTPGKRLVKIRVIQASGRPIGLFESMARNFIRFIDQIPLFYAVGVITMFVTKQHQRLGDLAAGTLVVRDRTPDSPLWNDTGSRTFTAASFTAQIGATEPHMLVTLPAAAVAKLSATELEVLEGFFARRLDMPLEVRRRFAERLAAALCAKAGLEIPEGISTETFLEAAARQLRDIVRVQGR
jgi:uncharacterized RDD family membrane protein YckC